MEKRYYDKDGFHTNQNEQNTRFEMTMEQVEEFFQYCNTTWAGKDFEITPDSNGKPSVIELLPDPKKDAIIRVRILKNMLAETDWKVIVNSELTSAGLPVKYAGLHEERQAWRDEINQLEEMYDL